MTHDRAPAVGERDWIAVTSDELCIAPTQTWVSEPGCGAIVTFSGTVRDHAPGRVGVTSLEYEVDPEYAIPRLLEVAAAARRRWPEIGRLALHHRMGRLIVGEVSVLVVVSTPHRREAFAAAEYCIDTLKRTVPIWKRETWAGGTDWSTCDHAIEDVAP
jgi:molybdopterin synthase catalytic subunit